MKHKEPMAECKENNKPQVAKTLAGEKVIQRPRSLGKSLNQGPAGFLTFVGLKQEKNEKLEKLEKDTTIIFTTGGINRVAYILNQRKQKATFLSCFISICHKVSILALICLWTAIYHMAIQVT